MQTRNYGLGSYLGFSPSVSLIYLSTKSTYELFFSEFEGLMWLNIWHYIVFSCGNNIWPGLKAFLSMKFLNLWKIYCLYYFRNYLLYGIVLPKLQMIPQQHFVIQFQQSLLLVFLTIF